MLPPSRQTGPADDLLVARRPVHGGQQPHEMPWLQLRTGTRGHFPAQAAATGDVLLSPPTAIGGGPSTGGAAGQEHQVVGDDQQIAFTTGDAAPGAGEAHVYRVTASQ